MQSFLDQQLTLDIPQDFISRFAQNYENRNTWIQSDVLYEWFGKIHYKQYSKFTREIERQLDVDQQYRIAQKGPGIKTIYILSQQGIKVMAMVGDKQVRKYYAQLEELTFRFVDHQLAIQSQQQEETKQQLEEAKTEIEELKKPQHASVYTFKLGDRLLYVGKDTSKAQNRYSQHFTTRRQIVANYQQIDIFMATQEEQDIKIEVVKCLDYEATQMEMQMIQNERPECNQVMTDKRYKCTYQGCGRIFKLRVPFEKHLQKHGYMSSDSETL